MKDKNIEFSPNLQSIPYLHKLIKAHTMKYHINYIYDRQRTLTKELRSHERDTFSSSLNCFMQKHVKFLILFMHYTTLSVDLTYYSEDIFFHPTDVFCSCRFV